ncbi:uncharacterized protein V1516DRAFT_673423 [Lipomyces oligophaga]|uniref:uncharacterized protein n=1 Tax=Lipomyces oligophaga TaxID=45792 RepID=UPI0034CF1ECE
MSDSNIEKEPSATLYIRNLDENIKIPVLKECLDAVFSLYGNLMGIIAHGNLRMRGQAFVIFDDAKIAEKAREEIQGFPLFDRPMEIDFAKSKSDATVEKTEGPEALEEHKKIRLAEKERKKAELEIALKKRKRHGGALANARASKRTAIADELLPPNKILFLQNLPDEITSEQLISAFEPFPGFIEVRLVPGRKGIGFVEYEQDENAVAAKEGTVDLRFGDLTPKITYARK